MDDLRVENYEAEEVSRKKKKILKRIAIAGGTIGVVLSLFGFVMLESIDAFTPPGHQVVVREERLPGGAGAWFFSWVGWSDWPRN